MKKYFVLLLVLVVIFGLGDAVWRNQKAAAPSKPDTASSQPSSSTKSPSATSFSKSQYSLTDPASIWVVANKQHPLIPKTYTPSDLVVPSVPLRVPGNETMQVRQATATALQQMVYDAKAQGLGLMLASGYRSYTYQVGLYNGYVKTQGQAVADTQSARPGYSEHQTGLAADLEPVSRTCELEQCFGTTPEGQWVAANAYKYGFVVRYTAGNEDITGYEPEPWHVRYVGVALATEMHNTGVATLEQFFNVPGGKTYN